MHLTFSVTATGPISLSVDQSNASDGQPATETLAYSDSSNILKTASGASYIGFVGTPTPTPSPSPTQSGGKPTATPTKTGSGGTTATPSAGSSATPTGSGSSSPTDGGATPAPTDGSTVTPTPTPTGVVHMVIQSTTDAPWKRDLLYGLLALLGIAVVAYLIYHFYPSLMALIKPAAPALPGAPITFWDQTSQTAYLISAKQPVAGLLSYQPEAAALNFQAASLPEGYNLGSGAWDPAGRVGYVVAMPAGQKGMLQMLRFAPDQNLFAPVGDAFPTTADYTSASWDAVRGCVYVFGWRLADGQLVSINSFDPESATVSTQLSA